MQAAIDNNDFPEKEILEILRIQSGLSWNKKKVSTLEISILLETILRDHSYKILKDRGISNSKIKGLKDELSFNNILNLVFTFESKQKSG